MDDVSVTSGELAMFAKAYFEGYWMAQDGGLRDANPYTEPVMQRCWDEGWQDAQEERRISER
jgi:ribosome modulation factor